MYRVSLLRVTQQQAKDFATMLRATGLASFVHDETGVYDSTFGEGSDEKYDWDFITASENLRGYMVDAAKRRGHEYCDRSDDVIPPIVHCLLDVWTTGTEETKDKLLKELTAFAYQNHIAEAPTCSTCDSPMIKGYCPVCDRPAQ